jgi:hypothetical protein
MVRSIPTALGAVWEVKENSTGDFQAIDIHDLTYKGSSVALPRPRLVRNGYRSEELEIFQLEVVNFIGSSTRNTRGKLLYIYMLMPGINYKYAMQYRVFQ